nr:uncharacterized protein LOC122269738 [Parasteatoda tepidariorum]
MSPGKKHRYSTTPLKSVDDYYKEHVKSLIEKGNNEHITEYLSKQCDGWKRLYPKTHAVLLALTSGAENPAESQSQSSGSDSTAVSQSKSRRNTGERSLSDVTAIVHQLPEVSLNSPSTSGMKLHQSIQNTEINRSTAVSASVEIPEQEDTSKKRFQPQSCTGKKSRLDTASPRTLPLNSPRTRAIIQDDLIQDTTTKSSTVVTEPVEISGLEGASKVLADPSLCHEPSQESLSSSISGNMRPADSAEELSAKSNPESIPLAKMPSQEAIVLARDEFVQELERILTDCENQMPAGPVSGHENDELNAFLTQFTEKIQKFRETLQKSLAVISEMELSPFLNISILSILQLNVLNSGIDVEQKWLEFAHLREGNSNLDMTNMTHHYYGCWCYFGAYRDASEKYIKTIPKEFYHREHQNSSEVP